MNLMFWKKKHDAGSRAEEAEGDSSVNKEAQEPLDSIAEAPESNPESPEQERSESSTESPEQESTVKTGLVARMKSKFTSFARYFSKAPAFQAGEGSVSDAHGNSEVTPDDVAAKNLDPETSDQKTPVKLGLIAQINLRFSTLALRFKKAPVPDAEENQGKDARHRSKENSDGAEEGTIKLGAVAQIKAKLAAMTLRFKRAPGSAMAEDRGKKMPRRSKDDAGGAEEASEEPSLISLVKSLLAAFVSYYKKHLIFTLLLLSLSGIVYNAWDIIFPPLVRKPTPHNVAKPRIHEPAPQTDAEALKRKSEEAQARADILKKESEEAQVQAEVLKKASEEAQAKAEELRKKEEEEKTRAEELKKKEEEEKVRAEALKKKNAEEKTRADALKKSSRQIGEVTTSFTSKGEVAVGSNDPKATAKSLKEAIEAMNNGSSGRTLPKPAK